MYNYFTDRKGDLRQVDATSDVARCIPPLLDAMGWRGDSSNILSEALPHNTSHVSLTELLNAMANMKYSNTIVKTALNEIQPDQMPCLFVPNNGSAIVLLRGNENSLFIFDGGEVKYKQIRNSTAEGNVVFFRRIDSAHEGLLGVQQDWFWKLMGRFKANFAIIAGLTFFISLLALAYPLFIMSIYDKILVSESLVNLESWLIGIILVIIANVGFSFIRSQYLSFFSLRIGNVVGNQVLRRMLYLPPRFSEKAALGHQISRIKDYEGLRDFFSGRGAVAVIELCFISLLIACLFYIGGPVGYIAVAAIIIFIIFGVIIAPFIRRANDANTKAYSKRQEFLLEMIPAVRAIKYTKATRIWSERYKALAAESALCSLQAARLNATTNVFSQILIVGSGIGVMGAGVYQVLQGNMSAGALIACIILIWRILAPLNAVYSVITQLTQIKNSVGQLNKLMNLPMITKQEGGIVKSSGISGKVEFSRVSIRYSQDSQPALVGVHFTVNKGHTVVIVGNTGSGKSSIFKLILGMHTPQSGRVFLDDLNVRQMDPIPLRKSIAHSPQEDYFFQGTVAQNILMVRPSASFEELVEATKKACVFDEIESLESGFSTKIKDNNILHFSSSFKKRLSLARAFLKNSQLLLLDNPDSGLTYEQQDSLLVSVEAMKGVATIFLATDNDKFMKIADLVLWMDRGRVRQKGTPDEVIPQYRKYLESKYIEAKPSGVVKSEKARL